LFLPTCNRTGRFELSGDPQRKEKAMFAKSLKGIVTAMAIAASMVQISPVAHAAGFADYQTAGARGYGPGHSRNEGWHGDRHHAQPPYDRYGRRGVCQPREAVHKALRFGMHRPGVARISQRAIVVVGWNRGHRAKITFARYTPYCRVLDARGI
jgi:hypothetical protein